MVFEAFPRWLQRMVLLLNGLLMIAFIGLLTFLAGREALRKFEVGEYMFGEYPLIIWPGRFIFTFGLAFFCFVVLVKTLDIAVGASVGRARAQEDRA
jgi:TRAP-type C4-dicarboxylate transport system permease small subunit